MPAQKPSIRLRMLEGATFASGSVEKDFTGRPAWAADGLLKNGDKGLRTIDYPATQLPFYIFQFRKAGIIIKTIMEKHGGPFAGRHARYVLESNLEKVRPDIKKPIPTIEPRQAKYSNAKAGGLIQEDLNSNA